MKFRILETWDGRNRLHRVWKGMHERCEYPRHKSYAWYGGRGIYVQSVWSEFEPFEIWALENGWKPGMKLDRRENDGPYAPWNCRFVTHEENMNNTRLVVNVTAWGETKSIARWVRDGRCSVSSATIRRRLDVGYSPEDAIQLPPGCELNGRGERVGRILTAFGETKLVADWVRDSRCKVVYTALLDRLNNGRWTPEEAITTPSGSFMGRQRKAVRIEAFGESKTIPEWFRDERCVVKESCLSMRIHKYGWEPERALTTPSGQGATANV